MGVTDDGAHNEAELMRDCGPLYVPIALESFATTMMCFAFGYLLLLITNKGRLREPGKAAWMVVRKNVFGFLKDISDEITKWPRLGNAPLDERFAFCRKANQAVCMSQIVIGVLTIERWLHINNVNGFRYLGYSVTCPPMMAEMVILIAPVIPCFKLVTVFTYFITFAMLITGYVASVLRGPFILGSLDTYQTTWQLRDLDPTFKFWMMAISTGILVYLSFIQLPVLALIYTIKGGLKAGLPYGYRTLLLIVSVSWCAFPVWWCFSYEGLALIKDTKANAIVFAILNVASKGSFTLQMLSMSGYHRREKLRKECLEMGLRPSKVETKTGLFDTDTQVFDQVKAARGRRRSETWVVKMLRPYDVSAVIGEDWSALDATFRAFLVGNGTTPSSWQALSAEEQRQHRASYDASIDMVSGQCTEASLAPSKSVVSVSSGSQPRASGAPRPGQLVTMAPGKKGRAVKVTKDTVSVAMNGQDHVTVCTSSLVVLKVFFLGVRGLQKANHTDKTRLHCSALVDTLPASEVLTRVTPGGGDRAKWDEEVNVHGFDSGDRMTFRLWGASADGSCEDVLGEAQLESQSLLESGFDGELPLCCNGQEVPIYLSVMIVPMDMSLYMDSEKNVQDGDQPADQPAVHVSVTGLSI